MASESMPIWTIYTDHPDGYTARLFDVTAAGAVPTGHTMSGQGEFGLHLMRRFLEQQGFACLDRNPEDHPTVVESWI